MPGTWEVTAFLNRDITALFNSFISLFNRLGTLKRRLWRLWS